MSPTKQLFPFVARAGTSVVLVRAYNVADARARVARELRLHFAGDDIAVRPATPPDLALLDEIPNGSTRTREAWADDVQTGRTYQETAP